VVTVFAHHNVSEQARADAGTGDHTLQLGLHRSAHLGRRGIDGHHMLHTNKAAGAVVDLFSDLLTDPYQGLSAGRILLLILGQVVLDSLDRQVLGDRTAIAPLGPGLGRFRRRGGLLSLSNGFVSLHALQGQQVLLRVDLLGTGPVHAPDQILELSLGLL